MKGVQPGAGPDPALLPLPTVTGRVIPADTPAEHSRAAIDHLERNSADLIRLDMVMEEGFDGLDTYRVVHEPWPNIACFIASGFAESDRAREARALGTENFIKKPYTLDQLAHAARKALDTP